MIDEAYYQERTEQLYEMTRECFQLMDYDRIVMKIPTEPIDYTSSLIMIVHT